MTTVNQGRTRGRPRGSFKPVEQRRQRKDYRLSPGALVQIEQGQALASSENETAFLELAIAHYVAFLVGNVQQQESDTKELEQLRAQVRDLEHALSTTQIALRRAQDMLARGKETPFREQAKYIGLRNAYQIYVRHELGACPALPDGFSYTNLHGLPHQCPVHEVFSEVCLVDHARRELEKLKKVQGITRIWLAKNGHPLERDDWEKKGDAWIKN